MRLFLDTEFTGLHQQARLVSLALVTEGERSFYAELTDYPVDDCDPWVIEHVIPLTRWLSKGETSPFVRDEGDLRACLGDRAAVATELRVWLGQWERVEVWGDCLAYDWVLFCELFGGAKKLPETVFYMPFDLVTLFELRGLDPDTDRVRFAGMAAGASHRHDALWDARITRACYGRLRQRKKTWAGVI